MLPRLEPKGDDAARAQRCGICRKNSASYTCPKCSLMYCSLSCYKSPQHESCSESFYKANVIQSWRKGKKIQSDDDTLESQKRLIGILKNFSSSQEQTGSSQEEKKTWEYEIPEKVKDTVRSLEKEFVAADLHRSKGAELHDDDEDRPLTQEEEQELTKLIDTVDADRLLGLLSPEQRKEFESMLKNNDYIIDNDCDMD